MNKILVTGASGQLAQEIQRIENSYDNEFFFADKSVLDILETQAVENFINANSIDAIINCAAYTNVDKAEDEQSLADAVNYIAVKNLAQISLKHNIKLLHVSTDYVFDGKNFQPYTEEDVTNPQTVYGKSKQDGEKAILDLQVPNSAIIRTSWLYSSFGNNFVKTIIRLAKDKDELNVVADQVGSPTYAHELANTLVKLLHSLTCKDTQIYHFANQGICSWYDFAHKIVHTCKLDCNIKAIESKEYPTKAKRPYFSVLNTGKIRADMNIDIPHWEESLLVCLKKMKEV